MPTPFKIKLTGKIGPVELVNYANEYQCREVMLGQIKEVATDLASKKIMYSSNASIWNRATYMVNPGRLFMYIFQNDIHNVEMSVECYDDHIRRQLVRVAPELIDRYGGKVEMNDVTVKDPFMNQSTVYMVARSDGPEAIAAIWWSILFGRLALYAFNNNRRTQVYTSAKQIIDRSPTYEDSCWFSSEDRNRHLQVWENGGANEAPVGKWLLCSSGPCLFRNGVDVVENGAPYILMKETAESYKLRDYILSLY